MQKTRISLLAALMACTLFGCASDKKETKYDGLSASQLYEEGVRLSRKKHYLESAEYFEALEARYPFGQYAEKAKLAEIYAYFKKEDYPAALASAERFIKVHPRHEHVDYAYYMKGLAHYHEALGTISKYFPVERSERDVQSSKDAFLAFQALIQRFPYSLYVSDAEQRMLYLRNAIAENELAAAHFYLIRGAYVAAANRAKTVIVDFDGAPAVEEALFLQARAYQYLGLNDLADDTRRVLTLNYPNSPFLEALA